MSRRSLVTRFCRSVIREVENFSSDKISYDGLTFRAPIRPSRGFLESQIRGFRGVGTAAQSLSSAISVSSKDCGTQFGRINLLRCGSRFDICDSFKASNRIFFYNSGAPAAAFSSETQANRVSAGSDGVRNTFSSAELLERKVRKAGSEKSHNMLMYLLAMVVAVVGGTYAAVPLYRRFCQATGYGGTVQRRETVEEKVARHGSEAANRELVVTFNADVADSMPWKFTPCQHQVKVRPGQSTLVFYTAENTSTEAITGVSTYNVAPMQAGIYFNKIQCFCFEEQRLRAGEKIDMPVLFYIDPEFAEDPKMDNINSLILSYTFFKVEEDEDEEENTASG
ncbi:hypothetical protein R1flu_015370 [Riccia fluitans]|uniref:Cytochrome c oxidase assembly protein n=1 Tax=Riccia fluitans TaxID=41844 RepID=A0ABD1YLX4_9MARC